jgi:hypothetical protein
VSIVTLVALGMALMIMVQGITRRDMFLGWMAATVATLAIIAISWEGFSVFLVPPCELR